MISEKEKNQMKLFCEAFPKLSDFDKGLIIGKVEEVTRREKESKKNDISS